MKYQYQTRPHPDGDCMRACIATLLELPIMQVPDFITIPDKPDAKEEDYPEWYLAMQIWLRQFGLTFIEIQLQKRTWMPLPCETLAIFMGPHASGSKHAIIGKCVDGGFFPVFDPLGEDTAPFTSVEAVCLLVPVDPMTIVRMGKALEEIETTSRGITNRILGDSIRDTAREALGKKRFDTPTIFGADGVATQSSPEPEPGKIVSL